jgi:hypothetical protein
LLLANNNKDFVDIEINFLQKNYRYGKIIVFDDFKNNSLSIKKINNLDFNILYIKGKTINNIKRILFSA